MTNVKADSRYQFQSRLVRMYRWLRYRPAYWAAGELVLLWWRLRGAKVSKRVLREWRLARLRKRPSWPYYNRRADRAAYRKMYSRSVRTTWACRADMRMQHYLRSDEYLSELRTRCYGRRHGKAEA